MDYETITELNRVQQERQRRETCQLPLRKRSFINTPMKRLKIFTVDEYYLIPSLFFETFKVNGHRTTWVSLGFWNKTISIYFGNES